MEVVDRMCVSAMRVATIEEVIGGRLRLHYDDAKVFDTDFSLLEGQILVVIYTVKLVSKN